MIKVEVHGVFGIRAAMRGMRYPKDSEAESDSGEGAFGPNDLRLLLNLTAAGRDHRKALRMVHVQASAAMPIGWWIQYDTYKVGTTANSRSRMHKFGTRELSPDDFFVHSWDTTNELILEDINLSIRLWQKTKDKGHWLRALELLPMSYVQERMLDLDYENLLAMLCARYNEKLLDEWRAFLDAMLGACPALRELWEAAK